MALLLDVFLQEWKGFICIILFLSRCLVLIWLVFTKLQIVVNGIFVIFYVLVYKDMMQQGKEDEVSKTWLKPTK